MSKEPVTNMTKLAMKLPSRDRRILSQRLDGQTLREIADENNVSPERIRQMEAKAWARLRRRKAIADQEYREWINNEREEEA